MPRSKTKPRRSSASNSLVPMAIFCVIIFPDHIYTVFSNPNMFSSFIRIREKHNIMRTFELGTYIVQVLYEILNRPQRHAWLLNAAIKTAFSIF